MPEKVISNDWVTVYHGDCREVLTSLPSESIDSIVTDPPYELAFMGKKWDATGIAYDPVVWRECLRVLKPGGHLLAFGGTRTWHRVAVAIEDSGFEIRDSIAWMYGSGFPKSLDVSKAIDKAAGVTGAVIGVRTFVKTSTGQNSGWNANAVAATGSQNVHAPASDDAVKWTGWGTALKPAHEPVVVARKPLIGTVAENVLAHGTGALNIDGCRMGNGEDKDDERWYLWQRGESVLQDSKGMNTPGRIAPKPATAAGRWPANVILNESQAAELDRQSGWHRDGVAVNRNRERREPSDVPYAPAGVDPTDVTYGGEGGASRFFYVPKANKKERPRNGDIAHPTVKPLSLMRYLVRLVTPPDGLVLDPFAGSGATIEAAFQENVNAIGIELTEDYLPLIQIRVDRCQQPGLL